MSAAVTTLQIVLVVCFCLLFDTVQSHTTACNHGNDTTCLYGNATYEGVQLLLKNDNPRYLWFGRDNYNASCFGKGMYMTNCLNPAPNFTSIIGRMRLDSNDDPSSVTQVLKVHYVVPAGSYMGCGTPMHVAATDKRVDPVHTIYNDGWALNHRPHVSWIREANTKYTLVFWDAGWFRLQGMWINIDGDKLSDMRDEVVAYQGPINPMTSRSVFVFALYKQSKTLDRMEAYKKVTGMREMDGYIKLNEIVSTMSLGDPVGMSYIITKADTFYAEMGRKYHWINNCPYLLTTVVKKEKDMLPWNTEDLHLSVSIEVTYHSAMIEFDSCCQKHKIPFMPLRMDPRATRPVDTVYTRTTPSVTLIQTDLMDPYFFHYPGRSFTLLLLDITESSINVTDKAVIHWQVINIRDDKLETGETILSYLEPKMPVASHERNFTFLLLEQKTSLTRQQVEAIRGSNCQPTYRCHFDVAKFLKDLDLKVVGMSRFRTKRDAYSRHMLYTRDGASKSVACNGVSGFSDPCMPKPPVCSGMMSLPSFLAMMLSFLLALQLKF